jgi:hypothetical protein
LSSDPSPLIMYSPGSFHLRTYCQRTVRRLNLPTLSLLALLQRTPVVQTVASTEEFVLTSPIANVLKSFVASIASIGGMNSLAGATPLTPSVGAETGISIPVGVAVSPAIGFTVTPTQTPIKSWDVRGQLPPGLDFSGLTAPGTVNTQSLLMGGTPTTAGVYPVTFQVFDAANKGGFSSAIYTYTITVTGAAATAPAITTQPLSQSVAAGGSVTFTVAASGSPAPTLQWRKDGANIAGQTGTSLALTGVQAANAGTYTVVATNSAGSATSAGAVLTVTTAGGTDTAPVVTASPQGHTIATGSSVVFDVAATGANISYQWKKGGTAILGATTRLLMLSNAQASDAGSYTVTLTNSAGTVTSSPAVLNVVSTTDAGRIINVSVRTTTGTGNDVLIVGFVTGGPGTSGSKDLLIRGLGPRLADFGVPSIVADPVIEVIPQGSTVAAAENNDWAGNATVTATGAAVGATPLTTNTSKDAALVASLASGAYSVKVSGANNTTGTTLAEVYDAAPSAGGASTPRLVNISARAQMSNDNPIIAGFVIVGTTAKTVMIRGVGPFLSQFFGASAMADPSLKAYVSQNGSNTLITSNDDWAGSAQVTAVAQSVGAFALTDAASKDSVLLLTLDPGVYSAQVNSTNNASGIALLEVYAVP